MQLSREKTAPVARTTEVQTVCVLVVKGGSEEGFCFDQNSVWSNDHFDRPTSIAITMVLPPLIPSQPRVRTNGLPSSLDRLARRPDSRMLGCPSVSQTMNTSNNASIDRVSSNHSHAASNHSFRGSPVVHDMEKISIDLSQSEHKRREWTSVVVKICKPPQPNNTRKAEKVEILSPTGSSAKPFSNFRKLRTTGKGTEKHPKTQEPSSHSYEKSESRDRFGEKLQLVKTVPSSIITNDFGRGESRLEELFPRSKSVSGRRVRFREADMMVPDATSISLDSTISTLSSLKSKRSSSSLKRSLDISNHRCPRTKNAPKTKSLLEKRFWTPHELNEMRESAKKRVQKFQAKHPATVRQVDRLYGDFCSLNNKKDEQDFDEEDEEKEEMLRAFLEDWAAFGLRGLEEDVTARRMFLEDRRMSIGSVLTYQERLKAQERNQRMFSLYTSTTQEDVATLENRAELLRARCESTSHRARMFAMYMALGDALFVANEDTTISF